MIHDVLTDIAAALCVQIEMDGSPPVCFCGVVPGDSLTADVAGWCDDTCGVAWVRLIAATMVSGVGDANETAGNCGATVGFDVEVGILRCQRIPEEDETLSAEEQTETARQQAADVQTILRAICRSVDEKDYIIRDYAPMGPLGGLVGGAWSISTVL